MTSGLPEMVFHVHPTDCDMLGHVNHATMLVLLERARWALLEARGIHEFASMPAYAVVRHVDIGYFAQSLPGDDLVVRSGLLAVKTTSFVVRQDVRKLGSDTLVAEASIVFVTIDRAGKPVPVPDEWRTMFVAWPTDPDRGGG